MRDGDIEAEYAADYYTAPASDPITGDSGKRVHAVRVIIQEDRYIIGKHQWFCDRTTEKTVSLSVYKILYLIIILLILSTVIIFELHDILFQPR